MHARRRHLRLLRPGVRHPQALLLGREQASRDPLARSCGRHRLSGHRAAHGRPRGLLPSRPAVWPEHHRLGGAGAALRVLGRDPGLEPTRRADLPAQGLADGSGQPRGAGHQCHHRRPDRGHRQGRVHQSQARRPAFHACRAAVGCRLRRASATGSRPAGPGDRRGAQGHGEHDRRGHRARLS